MQPGDSSWDRPAPAGADGTQGPPYPGLAYQGPPPTIPPPSGWRTPRVVEPPAPRQLPIQDHQQLDEDEARARTLTQGIGIIAGAILLIVLFALCGRALLP